MSGTSLWGAPVGGIRGLQVNQIIRKCINRTGGVLTEGDLVQIDIAATDTDVSNYIIGEDNSIFGNIVKPHRPTCNSVPVGIVVGGYDGDGQGSTTYADNASTYVLFQGIVKAYVGSWGSAPYYAEKYRGLTVYGATWGVAANTKYYLYTKGVQASATEPQARIVAWPLEQSGTAKSKAWVIFDGLSNSFGGYAEV